MFSTITNKNQRDFNMQAIKTEEHEKLLNYASSIQGSSTDLRSKLTTLILYTEQAESLNEDQKAFILNVCDRFNEKNNELIALEEGLIKLIKQVLDRAQ